MGIGRVVFSEIYLVLFILNESFKLDRIRYLESNGGNKDEN